MGKTLFGISFAALIEAFVVGFAVADSQARHAAPKAPPRCGNRRSISACSRT
jgi:hypothetical protein